MKTKKAVSAQESISKAGDALERTGMVISILCLVLGLVLMFGGASPVLLAGIPLGLLVMITGYTKKTSAATMAMFIMKSDELARTSADQRL